MRQYKVLRLTLIFMGRLIPSFCFLSFNPRPRIPSGSIGSCSGPTPSGLDRGSASCLVLPLSWPCSCRSLQQLVPCEAQRELSRLCCRPGLLSLLGTVVPPQPIPQPIPFITPLLFLPLSHPPSPHAGLSPHVTCSDRSPLPPIYHGDPKPSLLPVLLLSDCPSPSVPHRSPHSRIRVPPCGRGQHPPSTLPHPQPQSLLLGHLQK